MLGLVYLVSGVCAYVFDFQGPWSLPYALVGAWFASKSTRDAILWCLAALLILENLPALAAILMLTSSIGTFILGSKGYLGDK